MPEPPCRPTPLDHIAGVFVFVRLDQLHQGVALHDGDLVLGAVVEQLRFRVVPRLDDLLQPADLLPSQFAVGVGGQALELLTDPSDVVGLRQRPVVIERPVQPR